MIRWAGAIALGLGIFGCNGASDGASDSCEVGSDCPSGACQNGRCLPDSGGTGGGAGAAGAGGSGKGGSGGAAGSPAGGGSAGTGGNSGGSGGIVSCSPNHDGQITRDEVPLAAGLNAKFLVSGATAFSSTGTTESDGSRTWDLTLSLSGDHLVLVETQKIDDKWFAASFPGASYAARLSEATDLLGVFEITSAQLLLRGIVSPTGGATRTEIQYSPAVVVLDFPLFETKTWTSAATASGVAQGIPGTYSETYENTVDAHGTLKTPFADFAVLRTRVVLTRKVGLLTTVVRSFIFTTECFGTIASALSKDNEPNSEWSEAAEVRRLSP